jgi:hypothetical protein
MIDYKDFAKRAAAAITELLGDDDLNNKNFTALNLLEKEWEEAHTEPDWPLPDWAERYNDNRELVEGTQLCTKDGRQRGNARIISIDHNNPVFPTGSVLYKVRTDIGTEMNLLADEINSMFYIGRYILKQGQ